MTAKVVIVSAITLKVSRTPHRYWRIGLTQDLTERKKYWSETKKEDVKHWSDWQADSLSDAQEIESYFINKGMQGGTGGDLSTQSTTYVYVF